MKKHASDLNRSPAGHTLCVSLINSLDMLQSVLEKTSITAYLTLPIEGTTE